MAVHTVWTENSTAVLTGVGQTRADSGTRGRRPRDIWTAGHLVGQLLGRPRPGGRVAPHRFPAGAAAGRQLPHQGLPRRRGRAAGAAAGRGAGAGAGRHAARPPRRGGQDGRHRGGVRGRRGAGVPHRAGADRRAARRRRRGAPRRAARRPALALGLVRRRLADRGDGDDRDGARPRVPRADRPLAAADRGQRADRGPAAPAARRGRRGQRAPGRRRRVPAAARHRGGHPRRRRRSTRPTSCSPSSTWSWRRCTPS